MPSPDKARALDHTSVNEIYGATKADKDAAFEALVKTMVNASTVQDDGLRAKYDELISDMGARYSPEQLEEATRLANEQKDQEKLG